MLTDMATSQRLCFDVLSKVGMFVVEKVSKTLKREWVHEMTTRKNARDEEINAEKTPSAENDWSVFFKACQI